jgi:hypothetical protein
MICKKSPATLHSDDDVFVSPATRTPMTIFASTRPARIRFFTPFSCEFVRAVHSKRVQVFGISRRDWHVARWNGVISAGQFIGRLRRCPAFSSAMLHQFDGRVRASPPLVNSGDAPNLEAEDQSAFPMAVIVSAANQFETLGTAPHSGQRSGVARRS